MKLPNSDTGFTLVELLVVASLVGILFSVGIAKYSEFNRRQAIEQSGLDIKNNLRLAQNKAFTGEKDSACTDARLLDGWYMGFTSSTYQIYGCCGGCAAPGLQFSLSTIDLSGKNITITAYPSFPIRFRPLGQGVENSGTITISGSGGSRSIIVTASGEIQ